MFLRVGFWKWHQDVSKYFWKVVIEKVSLERRAGRGEREKNKVKGNSCLSGNDLSYLKVLKRKG